MTVIGSQIIVVLIGSIVFSLSAWGIYSPERLVNMVTQAMSRDWGMYVAVIVRVILGVSLIIIAPVSQFPTVFLVLGWIAIVAAVGLLFIGRERIRRLIAWFAQSDTPIIRSWLVFGMAFGAFLIYGVL